MISEIIESTGVTVFFKASIATDSSDSGVTFFFVQGLINRSSLERA
jgi:hypothetical protein